MIDILSISDQIADLEQELSLFKIPQSEKSLDTTLVCRSSLDEVDSSKLTNHDESQKDDDELQSKYLEPELSLFTSVREIIRHYSSMSVFPR